MFTPPAVLSKNNATPATHILGPVRDDWDAVEIVLQAILDRKHRKSPRTEQTYRARIAQIRYYAEKVARVQPSRWTSADVARFRAWLRQIPEEHINLDWRNASDPAWTPYRRQPSTTTQHHILACLQTIYNAWARVGYVRLSPMALGGLSRSGTTTGVNARVVRQDLVDLVIRTIDACPQSTFTARQMALRDRFVLMALRGLGLRASELVGATMTAMRLIAEPGGRKHYRMFWVSPETAKGGKARYVPVTADVWQAFLAYREAFLLPAEPQRDDDTVSLVLSPKTVALDRGQNTIRNTRSLRFLGSYGAVRSRQGLYKLVVKRFALAARALRAEETSAAIADAELLERVSPHWLRHTFGRENTAAGTNTRAIAGALGHANLNTVMVYSEQDALDVARAWEQARPDVLAVELR